MNKLQKIWAIGDLHGHYKELTSLYKKLLKAGLNPTSDTVVFLGDYVDGGPDTRRVLEWLIKKEEEYPHWKFLYGNHEDLMLDALVFNEGVYHDYYLWWNQGGRETAESYKPKDEDEYQKSLMSPKDIIPTPHLSWLSSLPYYYETDDYFFVHAGLIPNLSFDAHKRAVKIHDENVKMKMIWIRDEFLGEGGMWVTDEGKPKKVIFGHTVYPYKYWHHINRASFKGPEIGWPLVQKNKIGIDGMAHNKGQLIAVELPEEKFYYQKSLSDDI